MYIIQKLYTLKLICFHKYTSLKDKGQGYALQCDEHFVTEHLVHVPLKTEWLTFTFFLGAGDRRVGAVVFQFGHFAITIHTNVVPGWRAATVVAAINFRTNWNKRDKDEGQPSKELISALGPLNDHLHLLEYAYVDVAE